MTTPATAVHIRHRVRPASARLGNAGLYIFCFGTLIHQGGFYLGLFLLLLGFTLSARANLKALGSTPAVWVAVATCLYVLLAAFLNTRNLIPDLNLSATVRRAGDLIAISGVFSVLVAWALGLHPDNSRRAPGLFLLGYLTALVLGADWSNLGAYLAERPLFGLGSGFGIYTLAVLLGLFIVAYQHFSATAAAAAGTPYAAVGALGLFVLLLVLFLLGQMRGAWLAALLVLPAVVVALYRHRPIATLSTPSKIVLSALPLLCLLAFYGNFDTVVARATEEWDIVTAYLSQGGSDLRPASGSYRIWLWEDALRRIPQQPLFGWGPGTSPVMVAASPVYGYLSHFHNLYLQLAVEIGLFGLGLFALWLYFVCAGLWRAYAAGALDFYGLVLLASLIASFAIVSLVQYRPSESGQFFMIFVGGLALSCQRGFKAATARR